MQNIDFASRIQEAIIFFIPFLFSLCFHEYAHGWVARLRGDRTAEMMGRLTLNPVAHADMIGTVILPLMAVISQIPMFGWAKPVPVNPRNLKTPKNDMFLVALAGPMSNVFLALVATLVLGLIGGFAPSTLVKADGAGPSIVFELAKGFIYINMILAVFNLIPLHPLDGGKVLARFLPDRINDQLENAQMASSVILLMLFFMGALQYVLQPALAVGTYLIRFALPA